MADKVADNLASGGIKVKISTQRAAVRTAQDATFGAQLKKVGQNVAAITTSVASPFIPGGSVVTSAINSAGAVSQMAQTSTAPNATGLNFPAGGAIGGGINTGLGGVGGISGGGLGTGFGGVGGVGLAGQELAGGTDPVQSMQSFNMQFLVLQQQMQAENRAFTTLSNAAKTRHDTAKAAIQNLRAG